MLIHARETTQLVGADGTVRWTVAGATRPSPWSGVVIARDEDRAGAFVSVADGKPIGWMHLLEGKAFALEARDGRLRLLAGDESDLLCKVGDYIAPFWVCRSAVLDPALELKGADVGSRAGSSAPGAGTQPAAPEMATEARSTWGARALATLERDAQRSLRFVSRPCLEFGRAAPSCGRTRVAAMAATPDGRLLVIAAPVSPSAERGYHPDDERALPPPSAYVVDLATLAVERHDLPRLRYTGVLWDERRHRLMLVSEAQTDVLRWPDWTVDKSLPVGAESVLEDGSVLGERVNDRACVSFDGSTWKERLCREEFQASGGWLIRTSRPEYGRTEVTVADAITGNPTARAEFADFTDHRGRLLAFPDGKGAVYLPDYTQAPPATPSVVLGTLRGYSGSHDERPPDPLCIIAEGLPGRATRGVFRQTRDYDCDSLWPGGGALVLRGAGRLRFVDIRTGTTRWELEGAQSPVVPGPAGLVATGGWQGEVMLWDATSSALRGSLHLIEHGIVVTDPAGTAAVPKGALADVLCAAGPYRLPGPSCARRFVPNPFAPSTDHRRSAAHASVHARAASPSADDPGRCRST